jgi:hypothetical protein
MRRGWRRRARREPSNYGTLAYSTASILTS